MKLHKEVEVLDFRCPQFQPYDPVQPKNLLCTQPSLCCPTSAMTTKSPPLSCVDQAPSRPAPAAQTTVATIVARTADTPASIGSNVASMPKDVKVAKIPPAGVKAP